MRYYATDICFNETYYVKLHSVMNIMEENDAKITKNGVTMVFSY